MGRKRAPPGAGRDVLQPESHVAHGNGAGAAAVRTSSSGSTQSRHVFGKAKMDVHTAAVSRTAERWKQPERPSSREGRTRGAVAAAKSGEAPTLATVWTDPNTRHSRETPGTQGHTARDSTDATRPDRRAHRQAASRRTPGAGGDCLLTGTGFFLLFSFWFWMVKLLELDGSDGCITVTILKATELDFEKGEFYGM